MKKDWRGMLATAEKLVDKYGRTITLGVLSKAPAVDGEPWQAPTTPVALDQFESKTDAIGVATGRLRSLGEDFIADIDNVIVVAGDFDSSKYDVIIDGASRWRIVKRELLAPGDTRILHFFGVVQ